MSTLVIKTNSGQGADVTIRDMGIVVPGGGIGSVTLTERDDLRSAATSRDLVTLSTDDEYEPTPGGSTLILNDGTSDVPQADVSDFLDTVTLPTSGNYGIPRLSKRAWTLVASRGNASATNVWLRGGDQLPTNVSPFRLPFDATIVAISATTASVETWDAEVYRNADVRTGGEPTEGNKLAELVLSAVQSADVSGLSVAVDAGDELGIFCRGNQIDNPNVIVWLERR